VDAVSGSNRKSVGEVHSPRETTTVADGVGCGFSVRGHNNTLTTTSDTALAAAIAGNHHDSRAGFSARVMAACHVCWNDGARR